MTRKIRNKSKAIYIGFPIIIWEEFIPEEGWVHVIGGFWSVIAMGIDHFMRTCLWIDRDFEFTTYKDSYLKALVRYLK
jgi:hypothetical protein